MVTSRIDGNNDDDVDDDDDDDDLDCSLNKLVFP